MLARRACVGMGVGLLLAAAVGSEDEGPAQSASTGGSRGKPDYTALVLKGDGHVQDSFSLTVQAAARVLGRDADYATVYCLSGNAFAPAINKAETCPSWWHVYGWQADEAMDTVATALGLRAQRLEMPPDQLRPDDPRDVAERKLRAARKRWAAVVRQEMRHDAVVITDGGWRVQMDTGLAPWCWWGVVTRASRGGDMNGACLGAGPGTEQGLRDRPLDFLGGCWALRADGPGRAAEALDATVLAQAVARVRGTGVYAAAADSAYGLDAMDAWIAQMAQVPFCPACARGGADGMASCAVDNVQTAVAGATAAAAWLRGRAPAFRAEARTHAEAAAGHYDRICALLRPATREYYRGILNDATKQAAHANTVLKPARAELAAAADEMEKALATPR